MIEINGNPNRRDLSEHHARLAAEAGATIVLNTDAHGVDTLVNMAYAVATARRAWLGPDQVANTRGWGSSKTLEAAISEHRILIPWSGADMAEWCRSKRRRFMPVAAQPRVRTSSTGRSGELADDVELDAVAVLDRRAQPPRGCARRARPAARNRRRPRRRRGRRRRGRPATTAVKPIGQKRPATIRRVTRAAARWRCGRERGRRERRRRALGRPSQRPIASAAVHQIAAMTIVRVSASRFAAIAVIAASAVASAPVSSTATRRSSV
jgi:hypothetical protein